MDEMDKGMPMPDDSDDPVTATQLPRKKGKARRLKEVRPAEPDNVELEPERSPDAPFFRYRVELPHNPALEVDGRDRDEAIEQYNARLGIRDTVHKYTVHKYKVHKLKD